MKKYLVCVCSALFIFAGSAIAGSQGHWGYSGDGGPEKWGELSKEYKLCGSGKNQSPVNLTEMIDARMKPIKFNYNAVQLDAVNNGHTIKVNYAEGSAIEVDGKTFKLLQFHFHTPSENHINGKSYPMEAHLVHADEDGNLAVVAVMFVKGRENSVVSAIWDQMPSEAGKKIANPDVTIDINDMLPRKRDYYRFNGSLTTPPCTEGVRWFVLKTAMFASAEQFDKFHTVMHGDTNRPIQPHNARAILE
jgi:carbonic anhydrase